MNELKTKIESRIAVLEATKKQIAGWISRDVLAGERISPQVENLQIAETEIKTLKSVLNEINFCS